MAESVTVHGTVSDASRKPLRQIRVLAFQGGREVERTYTNDAGSYSLEVPKGLTTLSFDTHGTLVNAREWHPSVVTNLDTNVEATNLRCDRVLMACGTAESNEACVDALAGYMFSLMWTDRLPDRAYAEAAAARLGTLKMTTLLLDKVRTQLRDQFAERSREA